MTNRSRIWLMAVVAGCAAVTAPALAAPPAAASTIPAGSVTVASTITLFDSRDKPGIKVACPAGQRVLGGGAFVSGTQHAVLTELRPVAAASGDFYVASAAEDQTGEPGPWALLVYAFCSATAPGVEIVSATSSLASNPFTSLSATCPGSKRLVGSGGQITGGAGQVDLLTFPEGSLLSNRTTAGGQEDSDGFFGNWTVTSYAVCVTASSLFDLQLVKTFTTGDGTSFKSATATCPSGMQASAGAGWADTPAHVLYIKPNNGRNPTSIEVGAVAANGFTSSVIAIAVCVR